eukprot:11928957-Karenia_brevis.AAC.1
MMMGWVEVRCMGQGRGTSQSESCSSVQCLAVCQRPGTPPQPPPSPDAMIIIESSNHRIITIIIESSNHHHENH